MRENANELAEGVSVRLPHASAKMSPPAGRRAVTERRMA
jgi:hypothetical protein